MRFSNDGATWGSWVDFASSFPYLLPGPDGYKTVRVQFRDVAGNVSGSYSDYILLDTLAPTGSILISGGAQATGRADVTLTLNASDGGGSGVTAMRFSNDGATWTLWAAPEGIVPYVLPGTDGYKTVRVQFRDGAGHVSDRFSDYILLDTTAPSGSVKINNNASSTNNAAATLSLSWNDGTGAGVSAMRFSDDGATWTPWQGLAGSVPHALLSGDGHKTVRVQFRDAVGNVSARFDDYILLDTKVPTGTITINGGASVTASPNVSLSLTCTDGTGGSGCQYMRFSNDGAHWTLWESVAVTKEYTLPGPNGYNTVRVQYRDAAGNVSERFSDYILLSAK